MVLAGAFFAMLLIFLIYIEYSQYGTTTESNQAESKTLIRISS